jgi:hypothetical protein
MNLFLSVLNSFFLNLFVLGLNISTENKVLNISTNARIPDILKQKVLTENRFQYDISYKTAGTQSKFYLELWQIYPFLFAWPAHDFDIATL